MTSAAEKRKQERLQDEVRKFSLRPENRVCMDCGVKSTPYIITDFNIFVCTFCAGLHRQHQFRVKGIAMSNFKEHEVEKIKQGGNLKGNAIWRAKWNEKEYPRPKPNEEKKLKDFIYKTYVEKRWYKGEEDVPVQNIKEILRDPIKLEVEKKDTRRRSIKIVKDTFEDDFQDDFEADFNQFQSEPFTEPITQSFKPTTSQSTSQQKTMTQQKTTQQKTQKEPSLDNFLLMDTSQEKPTEKKIDVDDLFAGLSFDKPQTNYPPQYPPPQYPPHNYPPQYPPHNYPPPQYPYPPPHYPPHGYPQYPPHMYPPQPTRTTQPFGGQQVSKNPFGQFSNNPFGMPTQQQPTQQSTQQPTQPKDDVFGDLFESSKTTKPPVQDDNPFGF